MKRELAVHRGFTFVPIVVILGVLLISLGTVLYFKTPVPQTASAAYNKGFSLGPIVGSAFVALFFNVIASRIAERRSEGLAVGICGTILLLANIAYGVNALRAFGVIKPQQTSALASSNSPLSKRSVSPRPATSPEAPSQSVAAPPESQTTDRATPGETTQAIESATSPNAIPSSKQPSSPSASKPTPSAPDRSAQPDRDGALSERGVAALAALEKEVRQSCVALAEEANTSYAKMKKPVATISALNKAMEDFQSLKVRSADLEKRLRNITDEAQKVLKEAEVGDIHLMRHAMAWERGLASFDRAGACDDISRACDTATDLFRVLKDHVGKWKVDAAGKITSPDRAVESKLFGPSAQLGFALDRQKETIDDLLQGDQLKRPK